MLVDSFQNRLNKAMEIRQVKQVDLVAKTKLIMGELIENYDGEGIDKTLLSKYMNGHTAAKQDNTYILAKALNVSEAWLMGLDVPMERNRDNFSNTSLIELEETVKIPVLGVIPAGIPIEAIENIIGWEEIPRSWLKGGKEFFGLKLKGDSMEPKYLDGDIVIFQKVNDCENGQECSVIVNGYDATFKKIIKNEYGIVLQPLNPSHQIETYSKEEIDKKPVKVIGLAKELRRKL